MNRQVIDLNNQALKELKGRKLLDAFELLDRAIKILDGGEHNHDENIGKEVIYRLFWEDCSVVFTKQADRLTRGLQFNSRTLPFLCFRFLKISLDIQTNKDALGSVCSCGFGWVVRYNFGIMCAALGILVGERGGQLLLARGFELLQHVMNHAEAEGDTSSNWLQIQLSVLNNQACVFHACSMRSETSYYLDKIREKLGNHATASSSSSATSSGIDLGRNEWAEFYLNIQILSQDHGAGAA